MKKRSLIVCSLAVADEALPPGVFARTIAVDAGAEWFRARDIVPNLAIGDFDSISADTLAWLETVGVVRVQVSTDKEESDLELALQECERRDITSALVLGALGGRLDHQLAVLGALTKSSIPDLRLTSPDQTVQLLRTRQEATVPEPGTVFSVITPQTATVSIIGARWPLAHVELTSLSAHGLSNESIGNNTRITVHSGAAFLIINTALNEKNR